MKNRIFFSPDAKTDLSEISNYLSAESPEAEKSVFGKLFKTIDKLEDFPEIGIPLSAITEIENSYHFLVSGQYLVFYRHHDRDIYIDRILHCKRDFVRILFSKNEAAENFSKS